MSRRYRRAGKATTRELIRAIRAAGRGEPQPFNIRNAKQVLFNRGVFKNDSEALFKAFNLFDKGLL